MTRKYTSFPYPPLPSAYNGRLHNSIMMDAMVGNQLGDQTKKL